MSNIWSSNKYINLLGNVLLFLISINFMHGGQLILPFLCLLIFIANKGKFKVNNVKIFILLCLFAITFCLFSYKLGLYCFISFCLPMAYYVGSNIYESNFDKVKTVIYIIAFGMACHLVLSFGMELDWWYNRLSYLFNKPSHYDIWLVLLSRMGFETSERINTTGASLDYYFLLSCIYYIIKYEKNKKIKFIGIIIFAIDTIFIIALARRTAFIMSFLIILLCFLYDNIYICKRINKNSVLIVLLIIAILFTAYKFNIFGLSDFASNFMIFEKFNRQGLTSTRLEVLIDSLKLYPKYLWGGQNISNITGTEIHDLWGDIYDYAGMVPYVLMIAYSIVALIKMLSVIKSSSFNKKFKMVIISLFTCIILLLFMEPMFTGSSLFLILSIIIITIL